MPRCYHWPCSCGTTSHGRCVGHGGKHPHGAANTSKDFSQYVTFQVVPFLESQATNDTQRMDAVWDSYPPEDNLKTYAQQCRGNGPRTRVGYGNTPIPKSEWNSGFLKNEDNKKELFSFINRQICKSDVNGTLLLITYFDDVLTNRNSDVSGLQPCNQAEADTRMLLHLANAAVHGHSKAYMFVRWTATLLSWRSGSSIHSGYQNCGWALVPERSIATFQFTHFTQVLVRQSPSH